MGGFVFVSPGWSLLPNPQKYEHIHVDVSFGMSPSDARALARQLILAASEAEGKPVLP